MKKLALLAAAVWIVRWALTPREPYNPAEGLPYIPGPDERPAAS